MIGVYGILNILSGFWYDIGSGILDLVVVSTPSLF